MDRDNALFELDEKRLQESEKLEGNPTLMQISYSKCRSVHIKLHNWLLTLGIL